MNEDTLLSINTSIESAISKYESKFKRIERINTSESQNCQNDVGYNVTSNILKLLKEMLIEKIGYFDSDIKDELTNGIIDYKRIIKNQILNFDNRDIVEKSNFIQPIPIAVITNKEKDKILVVKKNNNRTAKDSPERGRLLVYLGGHLREEDYLDKNLEKAISNGLHRELDEELNESISVEKSEKFLIYTPYNIKSEKHLAICHIVILDLDKRKFKLAEDEFIQKKGKTKHGEVVNVKDLINDYDEMEDWSKTILKEIFGLNPNPRLPL